jgi:hypothetical protein
MPYSFTFDLSKISQSLFQEVARITEHNRLHKRIGYISRYLVRKLRIQEATGLPLSDALMILEDLVDVYANNLSQKDRFLGTSKRALLLPHCSRKYMDSNCRAQFNQHTRSYRCAHCAPDCLVNRATALGQEKGYDIYVLPGGSCMSSILKGGLHDGVVGVACCEEIKLGIGYLDRLNIPWQGIPLVRNGCFNTLFNFETLENTL